MKYILILLLSLVSISSYPRKNTYRLPSKETLNNGSRKPNLPYNYFNQVDSIQKKDCKLIILQNLSDGKISYRLKGYDIIADNEIHPSNLPVYCTSQSKAIFHSNPRCKELGSSISIRKNSLGKFLKENKKPKMCVDCVKMNNYYFLAIQFLLQK